jgi:hypothetical protein
LLASVDGTGGHVHGVGNPGKAFYYDADGFASIGQGNFVARLALQAFRHSSASGLLETVYHVYAAARQSEAVTGVGLGVDVFVVRHEGVTGLRDEQLAALAALFEQSETRARDLRAAELPKLVLFSETKAAVSPAAVAVKPQG